MDLVEKYLNEVKVTTSEYIDLANPGTNVADIPNDFKSSIPSKKTVNKYDEVFLAEYNTWGEVEETMGNQVKVNLNPGMGNRPNIVKEKYDRIIAWKYKDQYKYFNKNRKL